MMFQNAKNGHLSCCATTTLFFARSAKIALIQFDRLIKHLLRIQCKTLDNGLAIFFCKKVQPYLDANQEYLLLPAQSLAVRNTQAALAVIFYLIYNELSFSCQTSKIANLVHPQKINGGADVD